MHGPSSGRHRRASTAVSGKLALKLGLCLCAGQLVAGPVFASAAEAAPLPVSADAATVKAKVTESVNHRTIAYGSHVRVTAKVINPKTGKVVTSGKVRLQAYRNHKWLTWFIKPVSQTGNVVFDSRPLMTGSFRSVFTGGGGVASAASGAIKVTVAPPSGKVIAEAKRHIGALYKFGAAGPTRFDCSGFTMYVYRKAAGRSLPHKANSQQRYGRAVSKSNKRVGDLIIFRSGSYGYHVGIYAGGSYMYDSPHSGARVGKHKIYSSNFVVRRIA